MIGRTLLLSIFSVALLSCDLLAQRQSLNVDPAKSEVHFVLGDVLHVVHGTFRIQDGRVELDPTNKQMSGTITVDAGSGNSGNRIRDRKMTDDELEAPSFSTVSFLPRRYIGSLDTAGDSAITVFGSFILLGRPHDISVPMQVHIQGSQYKATGNFEIPYVDWGMKDPSSFIFRVGKEVKINVVVVGSITGRN